MKLQHSLIALAVLGMSAGAEAAPLSPADAAAANAIYASGSSALRFSMASGFVAMCDPSTITVFGNKNGAAAPGNNVRGYACTLAKAIKPKSGSTAFAAGTNVVFNKYDAGGSINGIQPLVLGTALPYMTYSAGTCTALSPTRTGAFDLTKIDYACDQTNSITPQMGVSDVEAATIQNAANLPHGTTAVSTSSLTGGPHSVAMAGVAVNLLLYRALQTAQGLPTDDTEAHAPSIPVAFLATVENGQTSTSNGIGFNALIPDDGSATGSNSQAVTYCTRVNGSGTKAMHSAFLLNSPCSGVGLGQVGGDSTSTTSVELGAGDAVLSPQSSTGNVLTCLTNANSDTTTTSTGFKKGWAIGLVGSENFSNAGGLPESGWRFVKVGGVFPNQANGQIGAYPMTYENYMYWKSTGLPAAVSNFAKWLQNDAVTPLALAATPDVGTRNGILSIADITDSTYAGVTQYIARTTRNGSSCKPQVIVQ